MGYCFVTIDHAVVLPIHAVLFREHLRVLTVVLEFMAVLPTAKLLNVYLLSAHGCSHYQKARKEREEIHLFYLLL